MISKKIINKNVSIAYSIKNKRSEIIWSRKAKEEKKDIFKTWADSYTAFSKLWEDSYLKLYKPWIESTGEMLDKTSLLSKEATPQKYREFYDEWINTYQNTFGKFYPIPILKSNKETLEKFLLKKYSMIF